MNEFDEVIAVGFSRRDGYAKPTDSKSSPKDLGL